MATVRDRVDSTHVPAKPEPPAPRRSNLARQRALLGLWIGLLVVAGTVVAAWLPDNSTHVIGDVGEVFMMTGAAVLGVSIVILHQEATGTGYE